MWAHRPRDHPCRRRGRARLRATGKMRRRRLTTEICMARRGTLLFLVPSACEGIGGAGASSPCPRTCPRCPGPRWRPWSITPLGQMPTARTRKRTMAAGHTPLGVRSTAAHTCSHRALARCRPTCPPRGAARWWGTWVPGTSAARPCRTRRSRARGSCPSFRASTQRRTFLSSLRTPAPVRTTLPRWPRGSRARSSGPSPSTRNSSPCPSAPGGARGWVRPARPHGPQSG
mmetsp:Transcript_12015/g.35683  ORF Transcript_12015/g.35683 Transcript_12015/m.35683 type:complete len:230 (-) Transcript_12015:1942-2631(-)